MQKLFRGQGRFSNFLERLIDFFSTKRGEDELVQIVGLVLLRDYSIGLQPRRVNHSFNFFHLSHNAIQLVERLLRRIRLPVNKKSRRPLIATLGNTWLRLLQL